MMTSKIRTESKSRLCHLVKHCVTWRLGKLGKRLLINANHPSWKNSTNLCRHTWECAGNQWGWVKKWMMKVFQGWTHSGVSQFLQFDLTNIFVFCIFIFLWKHSSCLWSDGQMEPTGYPRPQWAQDFLRLVTIKPFKTKHFTLLFSIEPVIKNRSKKTKGINMTQ